MIVAALVAVPMLAGIGIWALAPTGGPWVRTVSGTAAIAGLLVTFALAVVAAVEGAAAIWGWGLAGLDITLAAPPIAGAVAITVAAVAAPTVLYAVSHEPVAGLRRQVGLLVVFTGAMELVVLAGDLLTLLIGWELVAAVSWALIGHQWRDATRPARAAHAFNATRAGGLGLFLAAGAAFAGTGSLTYAELASIDGAGLHVVAGGVVVAAVAKSAQVPFAPWLFSAMAGPTPVSALLHSATMVAAGAYVLIRLEPVLAPTGWFGPTVLTVGLVTALAGGVVAFVQHRAKHLLAASTSAQYGLMFVAIGAGYPLVATTHLIAHAAFKSLLFLTAGVAISATGSEQLGRMRVGSHRRATASLAALGGLALAAVPPLGGGWTKEHIVAAAAHANTAAGILTIVAGGLSALYIARYQLLAFGATTGSEESPRRLSHPPGAGEIGPMISLAAAGVGLGVLWLPPTEAALERAGRLPTVASWEMAASWSLVLLMVYAVTVGDRAGWIGRLGTAGPAVRAGDWLGLPQLTRRAVVDPVLRLAMAAGRFDDRVVDGGVRALARLGTAASRVGATFDRSVVDAGVRGVAGLTQTAADRWTRISELGVDGIVRAVASGVGRSGRDLRRLQTGAGHHYLTIVTVGTAVAVLVAALWR